MDKRIRTVADANGMFLNEHEKRKAALVRYRPSGRDEAVIRTASQRDRMKFIPYRMN